MHNLKILLISFLFFYRINFFENCWLYSKWVCRKKYVLLFGTKFVENIFRHSYVASCLRYIYRLTHGLRVTCLDFSQNLNVSITLVKLPAIYLLPFSNCSMQNATQTGRRFESNGEILEILVANIKRNKIWF